MKFALYQPWIYLHGGLERSILELVRRSRHEWTIYTGYYRPRDTFPEFKDLNVVELKRLSVKRDMTTVFRVGLKIMSQKINLKGYDALAVWCDGMGDMITFRNSGLPIFNICSTPLRAVFDPAYVWQALSERSAPARLVFKIFQKIFKQLDIMAWKRYKGVISTSREVEQRIILGGLYNNWASMRLFHPGVDWQAFAGEKTYEPLLLVPGRIMWTKNIELALNAFIKAALPEPWRLVVAGFLDKKSGIYLEALKEIAGQSRQIVFEISPSEEKMRSLYSRASAVLFPPLNEDWGIVPLEAMANAKPVMANNAGGPSESVVPGRTGWLLPPNSDRWAETIRLLAGDASLVKTMGKEARRHVRRYDWSEFVEGVDNSLETWVKEKQADGRQ